MEKQLSKKRLILINVLKSLRDLFYMYLGLYLCAVFITFNFYSVIEKTFFTIGGRACFFSVTSFFFCVFLAKYDMKTNNKSIEKQLEDGGDK